MARKGFFSQFAVAREEGRRAKSQHAKRGRSSSSRFKSARIDTWDGRSDQPDDEEQQAQQDVQSSQASAVRHVTPWDVLPAWTAPGLLVLASIVHLLHMAADIAAARELWARSVGYGAAAVALLLLPVALLTLNALARFPWAHGAWRLSAPAVLPPLSLLSLSLYQVLPWVITRTPLTVLPSTSATQQDLPKQHTRLHTALTHGTTAAGRQWSSLKRLSESSGSEPRRPWRLCYWPQPWKVTSTRQAAHRINQLYQFQLLLDQHRPVLLLIWCLCSTLPMVVLQLVSISRSGCSTVLGLATTAGFSSLAAGMVELLFTARRIAQTYGSADTSTRTSSGSSTSSTRCCSLQETRVWQLRAVLGSILKYQSACVLPAQWRQRVEQLTMHVPMHDLLGLPTMSQVAVLRAALSRSSVTVTNAPPGAAGAGHGRRKLSDSRGPPAATLWLPAPPCCEVGLLAVLQQPAVIAAAGTLSAPPGVGDSTLEDGGASRRSSLACKSPGPEVYKRQASGMSGSVEGTSTQQPSLTLQLASCEDVAGRPQALVACLGALLPSALTHLLLKDVRLPLDAYTVLKECLSSSQCQLRVLSLKEVNLSRVAVHHLCEGLAANKSVLQLDLSGNHLNQLGPKVPLDICGLLETNRTLAKLDLSYTGLGSEAAADILLGASGSHTLTHLDLSQNRISDHLPPTLLKALPRSRPPALTHLNLGFNWIQDCLPGWLVLVLSVFPLLSHLWLDHCSGQPQLSTTSLRRRQMSRTRLTAGAERLSSTQEEPPEESTVAESSITPTTTATQTPRSGAPRADRDVGTTLLGHLYCLPHVAYQLRHMQFVDLTGLSVPLEFRPHTCPQLKCTWVQTRGHATTPSTSPRTLTPQSTCQLTDSCDEGHWEDLVALPEDLMQLLQQPGYVMDLGLPPWANLNPAQRTVAVYAFTTHQPRLLITNAPTIASARHVPSSATLLDRGSHWGSSSSLPLSRLASNLPAGAPASPPAHPRLSHPDTLWQGPPSSQSGTFPSPDPHTTASPPLQGQRRPDTPGILLTSGELTAQRSTLFQSVVQQGPAGAAERTQAGATQVGRSQQASGVLVDMQVAPQQLQGPAAPFAATRATLPPSPVTPFYATTSMPAPAVAPFQAAVSLPAPAAAAVTAGEDLLTVASFAQRRHQVQSHAWPASRASLELAHRRSSLGHRPSFLLGRVSRAENLGQASATLDTALDTLDSQDSSLGSDPDELFVSYASRPQHNSAALNIIHSSTLPVLDTPSHPLSPFLPLVTSGSVSMSSQTPSPRALSVRRSLALPPPARTTSLRSTGSLPMDEQIPGHSHQLLGAHFWSPVVRPGSGRPVGEGQEPSGTTPDTHPSPSASSWANLTPQQQQPATVQQESHNLFPGLALPLPAAATSALGGQLQFHMGPAATDEDEASSTYSTAAGTSAAGDPPGRHSLDSLSVTPVYTQPLSCHLSGQHDGHMVEQGVQPLLQESGLVSGGRYAARSAAHEGDTEYHTLSEQSNIKCCPTPLQQGPQGQSATAVVGRRDMHGGLEGGWVMSGTQAQPSMHCTPLQVQNSVSVEWSKGNAQGVSLGQDMVLSFADLPQPVRGGALSPAQVASARVSGGSACASGGAHTSSSGAADLVSAQESGSVHGEPSRSSRSSQQPWHGSARGSPKQVPAITTARLPPVNPAATALLTLRSSVQTRGSDGDTSLGQGASRPVPTLDNLGPTLDLRPTVGTPWTLHPAVASAAPQASLVAARPDDVRIDMPASVSASQPGCAAAAVWTQLPLTPVCSPQWVHPTSSTQTVWSGSPGRAAGVGTAGVSERSARRDSGGRAEVGTSLSVAQLLGQRRGSAPPVVAGQRQVQVRADHPRLSEGALDDARQTSRQRTSPLRMSSGPVPRSGAGVATAHAAAPVSAAPSPPPAGLSTQSTRGMHVRVRGVLVIGNYEAGPVLHVPLKQLLMPVWAALMLHHEPSFGDAAARSSSQQPQASSASMKEPLWTNTSRTEPASACSGCTQWSSKVLAGLGCVRPTGQAGREGPITPPTQVQADAPRQSGPQGAPGRTHPPSSRTYVSLDLPMLMQDSSSFLPGSKVAVSSGTPHRLLELQLMGVPESQDLALDALLHLVQASHPMYAARIAHQHSLQSQARRMTSLSLSRRGSLG